MQASVAHRIVLLVVLSTLCGCLDRKLDPLSPCLVSNVVDKAKSQRIEKIDLLFMVDDSSSMKEEQQALESQFPKLIRALTTGDRDGDGKPDFEPATDLHVGVVSSDLGLPGASFAGSGCTGLGDDGIMSNRPTTDPNVKGCQASYPRFLSYLGGMSDPNAFGNDFACIAQLGTDGCGYEHQLESVLKALWPSVDPMPDKATGMNRIRFLGEGADGLLGHGDRENAGFMRGAREGASLLAVVLVTDEDDCSSQSTDDVAQTLALPGSEIHRAQGLRCFLHKEALYPTSRYVDGLRALRPDNPDLVVFAAIVGVPKELVNADARAAVDFGDATARDRYYDGILSDSRMQEQPDADPLHEGELVPSCQSVHGRAAPPRRIVDVARGFGQNGLVQSVCQDDFGPAIDGIVTLIGHKLDSSCLPRKLVRDATGLVSCNVAWELPLPGTVPGAPVQCGEPGYEFLLPPPQGSDAVSEHGGAVCSLAQLAVVPDASTSEGKAMVPTWIDGTRFTEGWYYDDFSAQRTQACRGSNAQRLAYTVRTRPPTGVTVRLDCVDERQSLSMPRTDVLGPQPAIGDACNLTSGSACAVRLAAPNARFPDGVDHSMFCHPRLNVCVRGCGTDADCPPAWVCDSRSETLETSVSSSAPHGRALCVNPTCGGAR